MLTNDKEKRICKKYTKRDEWGFVHCAECPLKHGDPKRFDFRCKAWCHYNRHAKEWEPDKEKKE